MNVCVIRRLESLLYLQAYDVTTRGHPCSLVMCRLGETTARLQCDHKETPLYDYDVTTTGHPCLFVVRRLGQTTARL